MYAVHRKVQQTLPNTSLSTLRKCVLISTLFTHVHMYICFHEFKTNFFIWNLMWQSNMQNRTGQRRAALEGVERMSQSPSCSHCHQQRKWETCKGAKKSPKSNLKTTGFEYRCQRILVWEVHYLTFLSVAPPEVCSHCWHA
jgi:hypothetical protein